MNRYHILYIEKPGDIVSKGITLPAVTIAIAVTAFHNHLYDTNPEILESATILSVTNLDALSDLHPITKGDYDTQSDIIHEKLTKEQI